MSVRHAPIAFLCAASLLATAVPAFAAPPRYSATITRTAQGLPHVQARDFGSLGYGSGYTAAEDNGCIIADALLTVRGERSRWFGADARVTVGFVAIANLDSDFYYRLTGDLDALRAGFARTSREHRAMVRGFVAGYNRFLRTAPARFAADCRGAAWLAPMTLDDALLLIQSGATQGSSAPYARFLAGAAPPVPGAPDVPVPLDPDALPGTLPGAAPEADQGPSQSARAAVRLPGIPADAMPASNGWAFGARTTATRGGLLVGNPHFPWSGPNRFRRLHLTIPGRIDVMGAGVTWSPFVSIGYGRDVGWTHTVSPTQHQSLYRLRLDPADPTRYLLDGAMVAMQRRAITVAVKDAAPVTRTLYATRFGPVIAVPSAGLGWSGGRAYALRDAEIGNIRSGEAWLGMARSRSVAELRLVLARTLGIPYVTTIAADFSGRVLYADITPVPNMTGKRFGDCVVAEATSGDAEGPTIFILDGTQRGCEWENDPNAPVPGMLPATRLPSVLRDDWLHNENDGFWLTQPDAPTGEYSPLFGPWGTRQRLRTRSAISVLRGALAEGRIDAARAKQLVLENRVHAAELVLDDLLSFCPVRPDLAEPCGVLARWDRRAGVASRGTLLFIAFWRRATGIAHIWARPFDPADPEHTPAGLSPASAPQVLTALAAAAADLKAAGIAPDAPLGSVQVAPRGDDRIAIPGGPSSTGVLNAIHSSGDGSGSWLPYHGTSFLFVLSWDGRRPVADSMLAYSQSSDPGSPWFADGTRAFSAGQWIRLPFTRAEVEAARIAPPVTISE